MRFSMPGTPLSALKSNERGDAVPDDVESQTRSTVEDRTPLLS